MTLVAAIAGAFTAVRRAVSVPPAEAMRPEVPTRYRRSLFETPLVSQTPRAPPDAWCCAT